MTTVSSRRLLQKEVWERYILLFLFPSLLYPRIIPFPSSYPELPFPFLAIHSLPIPFHPPLDLPGGTRGETLWKFFFGAIDVRRWVLVHFWDRIYHFHMSCFLLVNFVISNNSYTAQTVNEKSSAQLKKQFAFVSIWLNNYKIISNNNRLRKDFVILCWLLTSTKIEVEIGLNE